MSLEAEKINKLIDLSLTNTNPLFISDTVARTNVNGYAIKAIETTVIAAYSPLPQGNTLVGETIIAGDIWYIKCSSITLTSGACFIYRF